MAGHQDPVRLRKITSAVISPVQDQIIHGIGRHGAVRGEAMDPRVDHNIMPAAGLCLRPGQKAPHKVQEPLPLRAGQGHELLRGDPPPVPHPENVGQAVPPGQKTAEIHFIDALGEAAQDFESSRVMVAHQDSHIVPGCQIPQDPDRLRSFIHTVPQNVKGIRCPDPDSLRQCPELVIAAMNIRNHIFHSASSSADAFSRRQGISSQSCFMIESLSIPRTLRRRVTLPCST